MKLLYFFVAITVLVAVAVALPAKTEDKLLPKEINWLKIWCNMQEQGLPKKELQVAARIRGVMCLSLRMLRCNCLLLYCLRWWEGDQFLQR
uniref:U14-Hexatoxin-Hf1i_1 n=1 Tax=Hadronyche formidabilis TaxID=426499 RepID=A0A4Q8K8F8_HADFO